MENLESVALQEWFAAMGQKLADILAHGGFNGSSGAEAVDSLQVLDANDVADLLKVPVARVYELQRRKQIGCVRHGRSVRFTRAYVETYLRAHDQRALR